MAYTVKKGAMSVRVGDTMVPVEAIVADTNNSFNQIENYLNDTKSRFDEYVTDAGDKLNQLTQQRDDLVDSVTSALETGTDTTLTMPGVPADAKAAGDRIEAVNDDLVELKNTANEIGLYVDADGYVCQRIGGM